MTQTRRRWFALAILCLGELMIVLDGTVVNVALPSMRADLGFSEAGLVWVVNAYMLTYGGFLLLGGRLGDLYGARRLFVGGLALFTLASLACGLAHTRELLIVARAVQGLGGAFVSAVALALMMSLFTEAAERAKAMGVYGFVCASGGSIGVLAGGLLTDGFGWHSIFLVNLPIGLAVAACALKWLPPDAAPRERVPLDLGGAVTITGSLMLAVYAIVDGPLAGWASAQTLALAGGAALLFAAFVAIERRAAAPLVPFSLFRLRNVATANVVAALWSVAMFAWFFVIALYLQLVLGYGPLQVGLAFLPANLVMAACSLGLSALLVMRLGLRPTLTLGLALSTAGLALFVLAPLDGRFVPHVLPGMLLLGLGCGIAFNPLLLAAMNDVPAADSGLASGVVNTAFMMGGAVGLAALVSLAAGRTEGLLAGGAAETAALHAGYRLALAAGALCSLLALVAGALFLQRRPAAGATSVATGHP
jgi:EmrB/QacA subfamily drug resistance transporter